MLDAGYRVAFHFDPLIAYPDAERDYLCLIDELLDTVPPKQISFISMGGLRMTPRLRSAARGRFPGDPMLCGEDVLASDGRFRTFTPLRAESLSRAGRAFQKSGRRNSRLPVHGTGQHPRTRLWRGARATGYNRRAPRARMRCRHEKNPPHARTRSRLANGNLRGARAAIDRPIGVFDSGIGGLTVLKALTAALPSEDFIYLGDTARLPYGTKSNEVIVRYSKENTGFLLAKGIKMLVVACNTSSAVALDAIASDTMVPVIGVIEPGARAAAKASRIGKIGVIGTEATIASGAYTRAIQRLSPRAEIYTRACPLLVPLAEEGWTDNAVAELTVAHYLESLKQSGIDTLLLGCTHYPLLREMFARILGPRVKIVDIRDCDRGRRARPAADAQARARAAATAVKVSSSPRRPTASSASAADFSARRWNPPSASSASQRPISARFTHKKEVEH